MYKDCVGHATFGAGPSDSPSVEKVELESSFRSKDPMLGRLSDRYLSARHALYILTYPRRGHFSRPKKTLVIIMVFVVANLSLVVRRRVGERYHGQGNEHCNPSTDASSKEHDRHSTEPSGTHGGPLGCDELCHDHGVIHLYLSATQSFVPFLLAELGFLTAAGLVLTTFDRRVLYLGGSPSQWHRSARGSRWACPTSSSASWLNSDSE